MASHTRASLEQVREATVRRHIATEEAHDVEATVATFPTPRYEVHRSA